MPQFTVVLSDGSKPVVSGRNVREVVRKVTDSLGVPRSNVLAVRPTGLRAQIKRTPPTFVSVD